MVRILLWAIFTLLFSHTILSAPCEWPDNDDDNAMIPADGGEIPSDALAEGAIKENMKCAEGRAMSHLYDPTEPPYNMLTFDVWCRPVTESGNTNHFMFVNRNGAAKDAEGWVGFDVVGCSEFCTEHVHLLFDDENLYLFVDTLELTRDDNFFPESGMNPEQTAAYKEYYTGVGANTAPANKLQLVQHLLKPDFPVNLRDFVGSLVVNENEIDLKRSEFLFKKGIRAGTQITALCPGTKRANFTDPKKNNGLHSRIIKTFTMICDAAGAATAEDETTGYVRSYSTEEFCFGACDVTPEVHQAVMDGVLLHLGSFSLTDEKALESLSTKVKGVVEEYQFATVDDVLDRLNLIIWDHEEKELPDGVLETLQTFLPHTQLFAYISLVDGQILETAPIILAKSPHDQIFEKMEDGPGSLDKETTVQLKCVLDESTGESTLKASAVDSTTATEKTENFADYTTVCPREESGSSSNGGLGTKEKVAIALGSTTAVAVAGGGVFFLVKRNRSASS